MGIFHSCFVCEFPLLFWPLGNCPGDKGCNSVLSPPLDERAPGAGPAPAPVSPSVPGPAERVQKAASASSACALGAFHAVQFLVSCVLISWKGNKFLKWICFGGRESSCTFFFPFFVLEESRALLCFQLTCFSHNMLVSIDHLG